MQAQFRELANKLFSDPTSVSEFSSEDISTLKAGLAPAGDIKGVKSSFAAISVMNMTENYMKQLITTSFIGFIYRLLEEYDAPPVTKAEIKKFLDRNLDFDPDRHVRVAHTDPAGDPERSTRDAMIKARCATPAVEDKLSAKRDKVFSYLKDTLQAVERAAADSQTAVNSALVAIAGGLDAADSVPILYRSRAKMEQLSADLKKVTAPLSAAATLSALVPQPPADTFYNFTRYFENNYEALREVTTSLYSTKPDIEFGVQFYDTFKTEEQAKDFCDQHNTEFKTSAFVVSNKAMHLLGPWKQNRDRVVYYDKNKEVLSGLIAQQERDAKLGMDLMKKGISKAKKKNIQEAGPDAPGLAAYTSAMQIVKELSGAERVLSEDEKRKMAEAIATAKREKENYEVPDEAIQVDVFEPAADGVSLDRHIMYTAAEKPLHLQPNDPHAAKYQPVRPENVSMDEAYIAARDDHGEIRQIVDTTASSAFSG